MRTSSALLIAAAVFLTHIDNLQADGTNIVRRACCMQALSPVAFTGKSLYQVESKWTTDAGMEVKLGSLAGKPQVVLMFFSRCTTACPILVNDLRRIEAALPPDVRTKVGFTMVSFDSDRDTPSALADYRREWKLPDNWTLLHGTADDVSELAALLGIQYKQTTDGQFAHSNVITVLDANGEINFQQTGLDFDPQETVRRIEQIAK
jgi:protein SCO1/2